jgi:hypothetical protein
VHNKLPKKSFEKKIIKKFGWYYKKVKALQQQTTLQVRQIKTHIEPVTNFGFDRNDNYGGACNADD